MIKQFFVALGSFLLVDGLWLTVISKNFYAKHLGYLMTKNPNLLAAGLFYLIYVFAMVFFVVSPGIEKGSFWFTVLSGALFGLCCYATYDLTNLATVQNWPVIVTIVDLIWGTFLSATIAAISFLVFHK